MERDLRELMFSRRTRTPKKGNELHVMLKAQSNISVKCLLLPQVLLTVYSLFIYKTHKKSYLKGKKKCKWPLNI